MVQVSRRTGFTGSALIDLLTRLTELDVRPSRQSFADRLGQWLGWTDAIALSSALGGAAAAKEAKGAKGVKGASAGDPASAEEAQCARVRSASAAAIAEDARAAALAPTPADFAPYRRRYVARQQAMATSIEALRARLRETLAARSPAMARLAEIDTVMAQVLDAQEHRLLATVPGLLEKHFRRLRQAHAPSDDTTTEIQPDTAWLDAFCKDMHSVWLAELELRLQPVEGLLEALRAR